MGLLDRFIPGNDVSIAAGTGGLAAVITLGPDFVKETTQQSLRVRLC